MLAAVTLPSIFAVDPCAACHPKEVAAYAHSAMAHSLRRPATEPQGRLTTSSGTHFAIRSSATGTWQRMERFGESAEFRVAYVIGSGTHASGYLIQVGDHLFQSPLAYYSRRHAYDLSPGYEQVSEPDFTRPVGEECVLCHSGRPQYIHGSVNRYTAPVFAEESISCERCHGPTSDHLKRPAPGSIVNPAKLPPAARDSVCEQCHLTGATQRILNPGKRFDDFQPGEPLEDVFTVYVRAGTGNFKVISHSEQLAQSACARGSSGKLWCGTCHDPHAPAAATAATYNSRCEACHAGKLEKSHITNPDCIRCHMQRRPAQDGGHTVFTDHQITRRPETESLPSAPGDLVAWREPPATLQARNLALAYVNAGIASRSPAEVVRGYRVLTEVERISPDDVDVLEGIGRALVAGGQPLEALKAFDRIVQLSPGNAKSEEDAGVALLQAGQLERSASYLERAVQLDPLLFSAGVRLQEVYRRQGKESKADALAESMRRRMVNSR